MKNHALCIFFICDSLPDRIDGLKRGFTFAETFYENFEYSLDGVDVVRENEYKEDTEDDYYSNGDKRMRSFRTDASIEHLSFHSDKVKKGRDWGYRDLYCSLEVKFNGTGLPDELRLMLNESVYEDPEFNIRLFFKRYMQQIHSAGFSIKYGQSYITAYIDAPLTLACGIWDESAPEAERELAEIWGGWNCYACHDKKIWEFFFFNYLNVRLLTDHELAGIRKIVGYKNVQVINGYVIIWMPVDIRVDTAQEDIESYRKQMRSVVNEDVFMKEFDFDQYIERGPTGEWQLKVQGD